MIITRSPLRVSIGGGGTDLPSYFRRFGGYVIAMAITKYVYISVHQRYESGMLLRYSAIEKPQGVPGIRHPLIRETLMHLGVQDDRLEITSMADVPAGTGLGSSGSFATALLKALYTYQRKHIDASTLAADACHIEIDRLREPVGKQDQYIAAFGGLTCFSFNKDGSVTTEALQVSDATYEDLDENLLMFYTGATRQASEVLREQDTRSSSGDADMLANLHHVKELGYQTRDAFKRGDLPQWAELMREHWESKKKRSKAMTTPIIDEYYELALRSGAIGGKLVGAGGGGFLLFYTREASRLRAAMARTGLAELHLHLDVEGTKVITR
jgi:D-glycero-alpha-D-manno-heptose-7-phosphate kinase